VSFTETAPYRFTNSVDLAITAEQLFDALADAEAWPRWASVIITAATPHSAANHLPLAYLTCQVITAS
jgi:hypothetical protein